MATVEQHYRLLCAVYPPDRSTDPEKYMADIPAFPNCVAWGDSAEEALENIESVVAATIRTYRERGYALPEGIAPLQGDDSRDSVTRVLEITA